MEAFDFRQLEKEDARDLVTLNQNFSHLIDYLKTNLELDPLYSKITIVWTKDKEKQPSDDSSATIFNIGINRIYEQNTLTLSLSSQYLHLLPFILLREAYYSFIPSNAISNKEICILINHIIEEQLQECEQLSVWRSMVQKAVVDYAYLSSELNKLKGIIKIQKKSTQFNIIRFLLEFIRNNSWLLESSSSEKFHDSLLKALIAQSTPLFFNDERIETLRMLVVIFYRLKKFSSITDYLHCFQDILAHEPDATYLNVWKFESNARFISKATQIAPSYQINWAAIDVEAGILYIRFHPQLSKLQIMSILQYFPFLTGIRSSESNFAVDIVAYVLIPKVYLNNLKTLLGKLQTNGYAIKVLFSIYSEDHNWLNLNYFREFYITGRVINPLHTSYDPKYELEFQFTHQKKKDYKVSMPEYLLLNRLPYYAADGFGFDRDTDKLAIIKLDLLHELVSQKKLIERLKKYLITISSQSEIKISLIQLLKSNQNYGFFYLHEFLKNLILLIKQLTTTLAIHKEIRSFSQLQDFIKKSRNSHSLSENLFLSYENLSYFFMHTFFPLKFENKDHMVALKDTAQLWFELLDLFDQLKLYDLNSIIKVLEEEDLASQIFSVKEAKLKSIVQEYKRKKISIKELESLMDTWIQSDPPMIKPLLLTSINTTFFAKYHLVLFLKSSPEVMPALNDLKPFCSRLIVAINTHYIIAELYLPNLAISEKGHFISILKNLLKNNALIIQRYFFSGFVKSPPLREFYDLERQAFFYTKDLFPQYFLYLQKICGFPLPSFEEDASENSSLQLWSERQKDFNTLVKVVEDRLSRQSISFQRKNILELERFYNNLSTIITDQEKYKREIVQIYFSTYIKSVRLLPNLSRFGLSHYYLYMRPTTLKDFDLKLLFSNTFTKIKHSLSIDSVPTLWIESIFPYQNPNTSYLYWIAYSKKILSEYCLFTCTKVHLIFHSHYNLSSQGWIYDSMRFKAYAQKIMSNPEFNPPSLLHAEYKLDTYGVGNTLGPESTFYQDFLKLYKRSLPDIKALFTHKNLDSQKIVSLLQQQIIYPYLTIKNADFQEKLILLVPSVKKEDIEMLIKIFSFFNYEQIFEIEGELFLYGFTKPVKFDHGLMIKLYMPQCELSEFQTIFAELFHHFNIPKYAIIHDLIEATNLLQSVYGSLYFLKKYHPLKNLQWDASARQWLNPKLFGEKFEKKYPSLIP